MSIAHLPTNVVESYACSSDGFRSIRLSHSWKWYSNKYNKELFVGFICIFNYIMCLYLHEKRVRWEDHWVLGLQLEVVDACLIRLTISFLSFLFGPSTNLFVLGIQQVCCHTTFYCNAPIDLLFSILRLAAEYMFVWPLAFLIFVLPSFCCLFSNTRRWKLGVESALRYSWMWSTTHFFLLF